MPPPNLKTKTQKRDAFRVYNFFIAAARPFRRRSLPKASAGDWGDRPLCRSLFFLGRERPNVNLRLSRSRSTASFLNVPLTINDLLSERAYSSSKRLIVRHKVIQQREQFCSPLDDLAFQVTFLNQFDLPVG